MIFKWERMCFKFKFFLLIIIVRVRLKKLILSGKINIDEIVAFAEFIEIVFTKLSSRVKKKRIWNWK